MQSLADLDRSGLRRQGLLEAVQPLPLPAAAVRLVLRVETLQAVDLRRCVHRRQDKTTKGA